MTGLIKAAGVRRPTPLARHIQLLYDGALVASKVEQSVEPIRFGRGLAEAAIATARAAALLTPRVRITTIRSRIAAHISSLDSGAHLLVAAASRTRGLLIGEAAGQVASTVRIGSAELDRPACHFVLHLLRRYDRAICL